MSTCCDDYCANHGCNQGRDCPARVASYHAVMRAADPLPASTWRYKVKCLAYWMLMAILGLMIWPVLFYLAFRA